MPPLDPMPEFDLYAELHIAHDADVRAIEQAWRAGVRSVHPDRASVVDERTATTRTVRLNIAREWLMDPSKRERYDQLRRPGRTVDIPVVDPLGSWPERQRRPRPSLLGFLMRGILVSMIVVGATVVVGIGSSVVTVAIFAASLLTLVACALYLVVWVLVGALFRLLND